MYCTCSLGFRNKFQFVINLSSSRGLQRCRGSAKHISSCASGTCFAAVDKHLTERLASECSDRTRAIRSHADLHASVGPHSEQQQRVASSDHSAAVTVHVVASGAFRGGRERSERPFRGRADDSDFGGGGRSPIVRVLVGRRSGSQPRHCRRPRCLEFERGRSRTGTGTGTSTNISTSTSTSSACEARPACEASTQAACECGRVGRAGGVILCTSNDARRLSIARHSSARSCLAALYADEGGAQ